MKKNLSDYVVLNKGVISDELCKLNIQELEASNNLQQHVFHKYNENNNLVKISRGEDPDTSFQKLPTATDPLMEVCWKTIYKYIVEDTGFSWFTSWHGFTGLKYIKYTEATQMHPHCDHIHSIFDGDRKGIPILTLIALLNDDFTGGDFILFEDERVDLAKGDILIFPSSFMFPHSVQKITSGCRYSAASWVF